MASEYGELPWLTPAQNAERRILHGRLTDWCERPEVPAEIKGDLDDVVGLLLRLERNMLRADELLQGMRTKLLSEAEWRELTLLVERARSDMPVCRPRVMDGLQRLAASDVLDSAEAGLLGNSLQQLVAAHDFLTSRELPWRDVVKRVEVPLAAGEGTAAVIESRVIPGSAFGRCLARGYAWEENASIVDKAISAHVPRLAQTRLTNATGETLFRGLHQGLLSVPGLHVAGLRALSDEDLASLVANVIVGGGFNEDLNSFHRRVEARCQAIRSRWDYANGIATNIQHRVGGRMAMESAAAALCSDPDRLEGALCGNSVEIGLFVVTLLTPNDMEPWTHQYVQHLNWQNGELLHLTLRGPEKELRRVWAVASVRQFVLSVQDQGPDFSGYQGLKPCVVNLLGDTRSRALGGAVKERIDLLRKRAEKCGGELVASGFQRVRALPSGAPAHPAALQARRTVARLQEELVRLEKQARALEQAGQQLKDSWTALDAWPTGTDAYKAAARLALVAYLMGETPVLCSPSGGDFTRRLDAEVKMLATLADCHHGHLPPDDLETETWESARASLTEQ